MIRVEDEANRRGVSEEIVLNERRFSALTKDGLADILFAVFGGVVLPASVNLAAQNYPQDMTDVWCYSALAVGSAIALGVHGYKLGKLAVNSFLSINDEKAFDRYLAERYPKPDLLESMHYDNAVDFYREAE